MAAGANILDPHTRQPEDDKDLAARSELAFYYAGQKNDAAAISEYLRPAACVDPIGARGAETALAYLNSVTLGIFETPMSNTTGRPPVGNYYIFVVNDFICGQFTINYLDILHWLP